MRKELRWWLFAFLLLIGGLALTAYRPTTANTFSPMHIQIGSDGVPNEAAAGKPAGPAFAVKGAATSGGGGEQLILGQPQTADQRNLQEDPVPLIAPPAGEK